MATADGQQPICYFQEPAELNVHTVCLLYDGGPANLTVFLVHIPLLLVFPDNTFKSLIE